MPTTQQLRNRLVKKLSELFQLDQPDLDFGFYRIMHAKAQDVKAFIEKDLLNIVSDAFGMVDDNRKAELQTKIDHEITAAKEYGVADPEQSPKVKEAREAYAAIKDASGSEADVYDHLYRFFERYYDNGDFISRRYYTRETSGKAAPFAIPYNGEEVKLHWANADQYYIKTSENFSNYSFDLRQAKEVIAAKGGMDFGEDKPLKVHFRVVDATEGKHGNVKEAESDKRFFIIHNDNPVEINKYGELIINFEYRTDPEKNGKDGTWREKRNGEAVEIILNSIEKILQLGDEQHRMHSDYFSMLKLQAPTENDKSRSLLAKYINQYTACNTMDYFIHKDLGGFLSRELDFYIKNEVMRLDDIENADVPAVESYLAKIKVLRQIASKLIDFLAQLEDFQKKLWLKKKFVVETNYCITLDRVPEELYPEIALNKAQIEEWVRLFAIDEIQSDLESEGYSRPLPNGFLKANNKLVLDTHFFGDSFKERLLSSIENFDEQCDGLLINSDNYHALKLLSNRYYGSVDGIYIDPPYNTSSSEIIYKNSYKHSSWLSLLQSRLDVAKGFHTSSGIICVTIDDVELPKLWTLFAEAYGWENHLGTAAIRINPGGRKAKRKLALQHEYALFFAPSMQTSVSKIAVSPEDKTHSYKTDKNGVWYEERNLRKEGQDSLAKPGSSRYYPIYFDPNTGRISTKEKLIHELLPIDTSGQKRIWRRDKDDIDSLFFAGDIYLKETRNGPQVYFRFRGGTEGETPKSFWDDVKYSASEHGTQILDNLMGYLESFSFPKSPYAVRDCIKVMTDSKQALVLDFFAGSGTTGQAVIDLNRTDYGERKYILVEMGDYFSLTTKPRVQKVIYSSEWKNGKPSSRHTGISHCFKYNRLESYEDTLNNLHFDEKPGSSALLNNPSLKEDYMLRYMLDVETRGSLSLLNISAFADPCSYTLQVKKPGTDEQTIINVDLIETFNYLIGLRVLHIALPQSFNAVFKRIPDPELPGDQHTKLTVDGRVQLDFEGAWWFRKIEGWVPRDPQNPNSGQRENVLIVWRKLTGDLEKDNLMLDEWFQKNRISTRDFEFDTIYVNGSNNLPNLKLDDENWKVRLIEEEFMKRMWNEEGLS